MELVRIEGKSRHVDSIVEAWTPRQTRRSAEQKSKISRSSFRSSHPGPWSEPERTSPLSDASSVGCGVNRKWDWFCSLLYRLRTNFPGNTFLKTIGGLRVEFLSKNYFWISWDFLLWRFDNDLIICYFVMYFNSYNMTFV